VRWPKLDLSRQQPRTDRAIQRTQETFILYIHGVYITYLLSDRDEIMTHETTALLMRLSNDANSLEQMELQPIYPLQIKSV
jgi:hypothetical protein